MVSPASSSSEEFLRELDLPSTATPSSRNLNTIPDLIHTWSALGDPVIQQSFSGELPGHNVRFSDGDINIHSPSWYFCQFFPDSARQCIWAATALMS